MRGKHSVPAVKRDYPAIIAAALVVAAILVLSACNAELWFSPIAAMLHREVGFEQMTGTVASSLTSSELWHKNDFITLKGLFDNVSGRQISNEVLKLENGMLTTPIHLSDMSDEAVAVTELSDFLESLEIPFLYIQAPSKIDLGKTIVPFGAEDYAVENATSLLEQLDQNGVATLDLRPDTCATPEMVDAYFYRTDHHWNPRGAFIGFQKILEAMNPYFDGKLDLTYADSAYWMEEIAENMFLGSWGRRVGPLYGGTDDLICITPTFPTDMSFSSEDLDVHLYGDFRTANIRERFFKTRDYYNVDNYGLYTGGQYTLVLHRNHIAPNPQKILLIKDSYSMPVMAYLSTIFAEVDVVDPREYTDKSIAEYIYLSQPDMVLMMLNPSAIVDSRFFNTGSAMAQEKAEMPAVTTVLLDGEQMTAVPRESPYNSVALYDRLLPGAQYRLEIDDVRFDQGSSDFVMAAVYSPSVQGFLWKEYLDYGYCKEHGFSTAFTFPENQKVENDAVLVVYAGVNGETTDKGITLTGIHLTQTVAADGRVPVFGARNVVIEPLDRPYHCYEVPYDLYSGGTYQLSLEGLRRTNGKGRELSVRLSTSSDKTLYTAHVTLSKDPQTHRITVTVPELPKGETCHLRVYAGVDGSTNGVGIQIDRLFVKRLLDDWGQPVYEQPDLILAAQSENAWNSYRIPAPLEAGVTYTICVGGIFRDSGNASGASVVLYDMEENRPAGRRDWDISGANAREWRFTVPNVPQAADRYQLRLYSGITGSTNGVGLTYRDIRLFADGEASECGIIYVNSILEIQASENPYRSKALPLTLRPGETYEIIIRDMEFTQGKADALTVRLHNQKTNTTVEEKRWYVNGTHYPLHWTCTVPENAVGGDDYILQIFTGIAGESQNIGVRLKDVSVLQGSGS